MKFFSFFKRRRRRRSAGTTRSYRLHKEETRALVHARLAHWSAIHPFEYNDIRIKNQRRAWGSCSSKKNLNFNWRLVMLPIELADYVVVHELCHTIHLNHSREFWALLISLMPDAHHLRVRLQKVALDETIISREAPVR